MKMEFKYIYFKLADFQSGKTLKWNCINNRNGAHLGWIEWWKGWRQYCFIPMENTIFSAGCLADIQEFLDAANAAHKNKGKS